MVVFACQPDDDFPALRNPLALKPVLLNGTWTVTKVTQFDREALDNGFPDEVASREITEVLPFTEFSITFNLDTEGRPGTFSVNAGNAPNLLILESGIWSLDNNVFTTVIGLSNPAEPDAASFRVKQLEDERILLQLVRNDAVDNTEYSYYEYVFTKN